MKIEINALASTTFYSPDPAQLFHVYQLLRMLDIPCAAINVHLCVLPWVDRKPKKLEFVQEPYVWVPRFEEGDVRLFLQEAGIPEETVSIEVIPFEVGPPSPVLSDLSLMETLPELHMVQ